MQMRNTPSVIVGCLLLGSVFGCSGSPTAPSPAQSSPVASALSATPAAPGTQMAVSPSRFGDRAPGVVYVSSQGLYYDTFVVKDPLPMEGPFQLLANGETEFGPGQAGYLGGRWWVDENGNGVQDAGDHFFLCPLLPPGRPTP